MHRDAPEPSIFIIFGALGDLSRRKLLPALGRLAQASLLGEKTFVLGVDRDDSHDDTSFREFVRKQLADADLDPAAIDALCNTRLQYQCIGDNSDYAYKALAQHLAAIEQQHQLPGNRAWYLALPPTVFPNVIESMGRSGLNTSSGWTRIVVEKPFGHDLASARELNGLVHRYFSEEQIYRIDHYLGKETVQNLLVFRLANAMIESVWNRDRVEAVQITHSESLGVGTRAGYYDTSGALRDMVQNHITQLLTLVAMEVPIAFEADAIRYEKIKVLKSCEPIKLDRVIFGQYATGVMDDVTVPGYLDEKDIPPNSWTETFVAMEMRVNTWRWQGVPFYIRTGKRLPKRLTQIALRFRETPVNLFESMGASDHALETADVLLITLQPDEGFSFHFDVKRPGSPFDTKRIPLTFKYSSVFEELPEAYQTLLLDVLVGDQTLFVHAEEVEQSWELFTPLIENRPSIYRYPAGTWGPHEADHLAIPEKDLWHEDY